MKELFVFNLKKYREWKKKKRYSLGYKAKENEINMKISHKEAGETMIMIDFERKTVFCVPASHDWEVKYRED